MMDYLFQDTINIISRWQPKQNYEMEPDYRDDLLDFMRKKFNEDRSTLFNFKERVKVASESGRHFCDIAVNEKIGIELKKDLKKLADIDRLEGQLGRFKREYNDLIVVLVGKTNRNSLEELYDRIKRISQSDNISFSLQHNSIKVIDKGI